MYLIDIPPKIFSVSFFKQCTENIIYNVILSLICFIPTSIVKSICIKRENNSILENWYYAILNGICKVINGLGFHRDCLIFVESFGKIILQWKL